MLCGCATTYDVRYIPVLPEPTITPEPTAPNVSDTLPDDITITQEEAEFYKQACDAWSLVDQEDGFTSEEVIEEYRLNEDEACNWAITGYTIQDNLTVEQMYVEMAAYTERLRTWGNSLKKELENLYKLIDKTTDKNASFSEKEKKGFFSRLFD